MNREIDFKKFLLFLTGYFLILSCCLFFAFGRMQPLCLREKDTPCAMATCTSCESKNGKKECSECSIFNEKEERIWVGTCIYEE